MKLFFQALAIVYVLIAALALLIGITGFVFNAWQGLLSALGGSVVFIVIAIGLVFGAREAWKGTVKRAWWQIVAILVPSLLATVLVVSFLPVIPQMGLSGEYKTNVWNYIHCHSDGRVCD